MAQKGCAPLLHRNELYMYMSVCLTLLTISEHLTQFRWLNHIYISSILTDVVARIFLELLTARVEVKHWMIYNIYVIC